MVHSNSVQTTLFALSNPAHSEREIVKAMKALIDCKCETYSGISKSVLKQLEPHAVAMSLQTEWSEPWKNAVKNYPTSIALVRDVVKSIDPVAQEILGLLLDLMKTSNGKRNEIYNKTVSEIIDLIPELT